MATFFGNQLDFIFFFYGLAFILLGATCFAVARSKGRGESWAMLGWFGVSHGGGEWLDLSALIVGDTPAFATARTVLMACSFVALMEFARLEAVRLGVRLPGRWVYVPLLLCVGLAGVAGGLTMSGVLARYTIGFVGAAGASAVLAWQAQSLSGAARRFAFMAAAGFALYAVAAGVVVPNAPFWPASVVNYNGFAHLTGTPIQLVRGLLACWISFSAWALWGQQVALEISSARLLGLSAPAICLDRGHDGDNPHLRMDVDRVSRRNLSPECAGGGARRHRSAGESSCRRDRYDRRHGEGARRFAIGATAADRRQPAGGRERQSGSRLGCRGLWRQARLHLEPGGQRRRLFQSP